MRPLELEVRVEQHRLAAPFHISGYVFDHADVVVVALSDGEHRGRGEASGVYYLDDDVEHMLGEIETRRGLIEAGLDRERLQQVMPAGGARNAVDCALWELEAAQSGVPAHKIAGVDSPKPLLTTFTLGADTPEAMARGAEAYVGARAIKLKLTGEFDIDLERVRAVRAVRPDVWLGVDANQGYTREALGWLTEALLESRVSLLEQPLKRGLEAELDGLQSPIPIAADESVLTLGDVEAMVGRFSVINIKLDKCGGLTEGLQMVKAARRLGLDVMVGNMVGTSLAMAPAFILGQYCDIVDLDGPIFLAEDRKPGVRYEDGLVWAGEDIWGSAPKVHA